MKKIILSICLLVPFLLIAQTIVLPNHFVKVNSSTTVPVLLTNTTFKVKKITLVGNSATRTANAGTVYVGVSSVDDSQPIAVPSGQQIGLLIPEGTACNLGAIYLDVTVANDGILVIYE